MARKRILHPEFFTDGTLLTLTPLHRLLFAGLWTIADREGRLKDRPEDIKQMILPADECDANKLLGDLATAGRIVRYGDSQGKYIALPRWHDYQSPHTRESASKLPTPTKGMPDTNHSAPEAMASTPVSVPVPVSVEEATRAKALVPEKKSRNPGKRSSKAKAPPQTEALGGGDPSPPVDNSAELSVFGSGAPPVVGVDLGWPDVGIEVELSHGGNGELVLDGEAGGGEVVVDVVTGGNGKTPLQQACSATWKAYAAAYERRWGVAPLRSAKANSQVLAFCKVVPQNEAPEVAAFFVASARGVYVAGKHDLNFLSRDAAGLRTEWATGRQVMEAEARQGDRTAATGNVFADLIEQGRRLEEEEKARVSAKV